MPEADPDRLVQCVKLNKELPGLKTRPIPTDIGDYIFEHLSKEAWDLWLSESVRFINTYGWDLSSKEGTQKLLEQLRIWLGLEQGQAAETAWTPPKEEEEGAAASDAAEPEVSSSADS